MFPLGCRILSRAPRRLRAFHSSCVAYNEARAPDSGVREALRPLLQHTAQPVSVLTVRSASGDDAYHGATLSSFSSISFHPFPIISFALQLPSRSADALQSHFTEPRATSSSNSPSSPGTVDAHLVINILSAEQSQTAVRFSRPDLHPHPFADPQTRYTTTPEGNPILLDTLGALSCTLLSSLPLGAAADPHVLARAMEVHALPPREELLPGASASMLYLARVVRVEDTRGGAGRPPKSEADWPMPLVYHRRQYGTVRGLTS